MSDSSKTLKRKDELWLVAMSKLASLGLLTLVQM